MNTDLVVLTFEDPTGAADMLKAVKELEGEDLIEILDAVVVTKDTQGKVGVRQPLEVGPDKGAAFGAVSGAVVGLVGGPAGAVVGAVAGSMTGAVAGAAFEAGMPTQEIESLADYELAPDESALLLYVEEVWLDQIEQAAQDLAKSITHDVLAQEGKTAREQAHEKAAALRKEKIDAAYKAWQAQLAGLRAAVAAARQRLAANLTADRYAAGKQLDSARATLTRTYKSMISALRARHQQAQDEIADLDGRVRTANAQAKAGLERRLAAAHEARQATRLHARETLQARLNGLKADGEALAEKAAEAPAAARQKLDAQAGKLHAKWAADQKRLDELDKASDAAWTEMVKSIDVAIDNYEAEMRAAEDETDKGA